MYTDHTAVKAVLETPSPSGKHARWWTKVYSRGVKTVSIVYRRGRENTGADALSRNPQLPGPAEGLAEMDTQVAVVRDSSNTTSPELPERNPEQPTVEELLLSKPGLPMAADFSDQQRMDPQVEEMCKFLQEGDLPDDEKQARKVTSQAASFSLIDDILYFVDPRRGNSKRAVVPKHLRQQIMEENHSGPMAGPPM